MVDLEKVEAIIQNKCLCLPARISEKYPGKEISWGWDTLKGPISLEQFKQKITDHDGFCIVTGKRSNDLEILDFDKKVDNETFKQTLKTFKEQVEAEKPGLIDRLPIEKTQSDGRHLFYRCHEVTIPGNHSTPVKFWSIK